MNITSIAPALVRNTVFVSERSIAMQLEKVGSEVQTPPFSDHCMRFARDCYVLRGDEAETSEQTNRDVDLSTLSMLATLD